MSGREKKRKRLSGAAAILVAAITAAVMAAGQSLGPEELKVELQRGGEGIEVEIKTTFPLQYHIITENDSQLILEFPGTIIRRPDSTPVNRANVSWVKTGPGPSSAEPASRVEINFVGPVHKEMTLAGENHMKIAIRPLPSPEETTHQAIARDSVIIDLHNDVITQIYEQKNLGLFDSEQLQSSWPRLKQASVRAAFFAVWVPQTKGPGYEDELIEIFYEMIFQHREEMALATSYADLENNLSAGKFSAFLAIEGGKAIQEDLSRLDYFYRRGVRYMTLVWNETNAICDSARDSYQPHGGLSLFGQQVVKHMNELGMIIDVSHASDAAVDDVLELSSDPIIASHSNCRAVYNHVRNLKDDHIRKICSKGGVIGINFYSAFVSGHRPARLSHLLAHIDHLVQIGGIDCVAIGSDYDGRIRPVAGLEHIGKLENLTSALHAHGYSVEDIKKIYGQNFLRLLKQVVDENNQRQKERGL